MKLSAYLPFGLLLLTDLRGAEALIRFGNQNQLPGNLESLTKDSVIWNSPAQLKPASFRVKEILDVSLPAETPVLKANHEATLIMARGDSVRGQIASVGDGFVELDTWFAGRMKFPREMIREVKIADRPVLLFRGPSSMEGWTHSTDPPVWSFKSGTFRSEGPGGIGRSVELPDEFRLAFDASWRTSFNLSVIIFSDDVSVERPDHGYEVTFQRRSVRLQPCGDHNMIGSTQNAIELQENKQARIEIRASAKTKTICFFVNDRIVEVWTDPNMKRDTLGQGIHFLTQDNEPIRISGIEVTGWDGVLDELPERAVVNRLRDLEGFGGIQRVETPAEPKAKKDDGRMIFRNGDSIAGEVKAIQDGVITLKTSFDEVKFPITRLKNITLPPVPLAEPKRMAGDVRGSFADGTSLVFRLDGVQGQRIKGYSQNFGSAEFDMKAFTRLEFNIYSAKLEGLRKDESW